ncbi:MAG: tryptophan synthase subunit alpha [Actinomycetota bacterium]|nr:tryptophan synthase subunit alpha [Actinomycetota bacterium]
MTLSIHLLAGVVAMTAGERLGAIAAAGPSTTYAVASFGVAGVGISTPDQAAAAAKSVDGVIVGSAIVRRVLEADTAETAATALSAAVADLRKAVARDR